MKKHLNQTCWLALAFAIQAPNAAADDLLQDAGSWLQVMGEGSL